MGFQKAEMFGKKDLERKTASNQRADACKKSKSQVK